MKTLDYLFHFAGLIVQHGMKVSCEATGNFKSALLTNLNFSMKSMEKIQPQVTSGQQRVRSVHELSHC